MERFPLAERSLLETPALSWHPGQTPNPRGQLAWRRKCCCLRSDFRDDLLRRVDAQTRQLCQTYNCFLMRFHCLCNHFVQAGHLRFN
jgi:hypothetical protein